ncbi:MAG: ankyrin repeat domain-containing protein [Alphaproteobacteria bacterium]|nr:ankyrin repeat domain-containing protein [Alphaproteobacteria bacterium]
MKDSIWPVYQNQFCGTDWIYNHVVNNPNWVENSIATIEMWLERGLNINYVEPNKGTMLAWAAKNNRSKVLDFLIKQGADVNRARTKKITPLMDAVWHGSVISTLLKAGAIATAEDEYGRTALNYALYALKEAVQEQKEKATAEPYNEYAFLDAKEAEGSVYSGLNSVIKEFKPITGRNGQIEKLSRNPFNVIIGSKELETRLKIRYLKTLQSNGFDPNDFYPNSYLTTKEAALETKDKELISFVKYELLKLKDPQELIKMAQEGDLKSVQVLIQNGTEVDETDQQSQTALMKASQAGFLDVVDALMKAGVNVLLKDDQGNDAFNLAMKEGHIEIAKLIKKALREQITQRRNLLSNTLLNMGKKRLYLLSQQGKNLILALGKEGQLIRD